MTRKEFVETISKADGFGIWKPDAQLALDTDRIDLYVEHCLEQDDDSGSRPNVKKMLGDGLYRELQSFRKEG